MRRQSVAPGEDEEDQPEHVEGGEEGGDQGDDGQILPIGIGIWSVIQAPTMISSFDQKPAKGISPALASEAMRNVQKVTGMYRADHPFLDVLLLVHAVDDAAGAEEEAALEERVRDQVEDGRDERADTRRPSPCSRVARASSRRRRA